MQDSTLLLPCVIQTERPAGLAINRVPIFSACRTPAFPLDSVRLVAVDLNRRQEGPKTMTPWYLRIFGRSAARSILLVAIALASVKWCCSQEMGWPREKTVNGARLVYYQPQVDEWNDFKLLNLRMAITITPAGGKTQPGVITAEMQTDVNVDAHTVLLSHPLITGTYFPSLDAASSAKLSQLVGSFLPRPRR